MTECYCPACQGFAIEVASGFPLAYETKCNDSVSFQVPNTKALDIFLAICKEVPNIKDDPFCAVDWDARASRESRRHEICKKFREEIAKNSAEFFASLLVQDLKSCKIHKKDGKYFWASRAPVFSGDFIECSDNSVNNGAKLWRKALFDGCDKEFKNKVIELFYEYSMIPLILQKDIEFI